MRKLPGTNGIKNSVVIILGSLTKYTEKSDFMWSEKKLIGVEINLHFVVNWPPGRPLPHDMLMRY